MGKLGKSSWRAYFKRLRGEGRGRMRGGSGAAAAFEYGWPSGGTFEPNVREQFLFDEASSPIRGEVNTTVLNKTGAGTITFNVASSAPFENLGPGVSCSGTMNFEKGADSHFNIGTDDVVLEAVASVASGQSQAIWHDENFIFKPRGTNDNNYEVFMRVTDSSFVSAFPTYTDNSHIGDGDLHKYRLVIDRSGTAVLYVDGVNVTTTPTDFTSIDGKSHVNNDVSVLGRFNTTFPLLGKIMELRLTVGNTTNNSGGPGGG